MNEWETEPNELDFEAHGLPCALRRGRSGGWCGYVGLTKEYVAANSNSNGLPLEDISVHGGVTYADEAWWNDDSPLIWIGFDCSHCDDITPKHADWDLSMGRPRSYRNIHYAKDQCSSLARQLKEIGEANEGH